MKRPYLEISIELDDEPNAALVEAFANIVNHIAKTLLVIGHPELKVNDARATITYHEPS